MNHEQATEWIFDWHTGRLDAALGAEIAEHAGACERCRRVLTVYDAVTAVLAERADAAGAHPEVDRLVARVMEPETLAPSDRASIDEHVRDCASCARELAGVRSAETEYRSRGDVVEFERPRNASTRTRVNVLVAGLAASLLLVAGFSWLSNRSAEREAAAMAEQLAEADSRLARLAGEGHRAVTLPLFRGALRSGAEAPRVDPGSGDTVPLAVAPDLPRATPDAAVLRFEIAEIEGKTVFELELTAGEIRRLGGESGVLALLVPAAALGEGPHVLSLTDADGVALLRQPFSVARPGDTVKDREAQP